MLKKLELMTSTDIALEIRRGSLAMIPLGATEQHGPHGPLGSDTFCTNIVAERVAERLDAVMVPTLPYGMSSLHMRFPGTLTLSPATLSAVVRDICRSLIAHGFDKLFILNSHLANMPSVLVALREIKDEFPNALLMVSNPFGALRESYQEFLPPGDRHLRWREFIAHGGLMEMALVEAYAPGSVQFERAVKESSAKVELAEDSVVSVMTNMDEVTEVGTFGDPSKATGQLGKEVAEAVSSAVVERVERLLAAFGRRT